MAGARRDRQGLYVLNHDGRVMLMNPKASEALGWTEEELRGRPAHDTFHFQRADGSPRAEQECPVLNVLITRRPVRVREDAFTRRDGSIVPVSISAAPLFSGNTVRGVVVSFRELDHRSPQA